MAGYMEKTDLISYWLTAVGLFTLVDLMFILWIAWLDISNNPRNLELVASILFGIKLPFTIVIGLPIGISLLIVAIIWFSPPMDVYRQKLQNIISRKDRP